ncbi:MAG: VWA domain-containing protein [Cyanobacteria bacterium]|nr:VWA domain-containing protein [Cyanobacteria bacterium CG_2015-16_32_12]NCO78300.1 VWA domain-containing protein [Cyanobacteria bacterium CG_2015-22_32_23]NCS84518.1 VWA domain-containing protein [Cyanobacteria bacterium CG_2015-02_32_10]
MAVGLPEFADNPENRCPVILLLDTSGSMYGEPINALNRGISTFKEDVIKDTQASLSVELAIITFGDTVKLAQDFITVDEFNPPKLEASGVTPMGEAMEKALILLETRKRVYKENGIGYYRPWIFLITDGAPTDNWQIPAEMVREAEAQKRCLFFTVAVEGADMDKLKQIAPSDRPPVVLNGLDFRALFQWLSTSMKRVSGGKVGEAVALPPVGWGQISI